MLTLVIIIVITALIFDFINGMNDAANSIATVVSTRVLSPVQAVAWAAFFNFVAAFGFGVKVANTIGKGIVESSAVNVYVIFAGLLGAIIWAYTCTHLGFPISVSHSLIGGLAGATITNAGLSALIFSGIFKVAIFIFLSPLIGMMLGYFFMVAVLWLFRRTNPGKVDGLFRKMQLLSAAAYSLGHGTNDAQKTMGIISILLFTAGLIDKFYVPTWVILSSHAAIALGTMIGGWNVVKTMGMKITKLRPVGGFCAESAGAITILGAAVAGIPVSTTHTITGSIAGVGSTVRLSAVRWGIARNIIVAWILTLPASGLMAAVIYFGFRLFVKNI